MFRYIICPYILTRVVENMIKTFAFIICTTFLCLYLFTKSKFDYPCFSLLNGVLFPYENDSENLALRQHALFDVASLLSTTDDVFYTFQPRASPWICFICKPSSITTTSSRNMMRTIKSLFLFQLNNIKTTESWCLDQNTKPMCSIRFNQLIVHLETRVTSVTRRKL